MFRFNPALNRRNELANANLRDGGALIQALRWFVCRSGLLLAAYAYHQVLATERKAGRRASHLTDNAEFLLDRFAWQSIIIELRSLLDPKQEHLGVACIARELGRPKSRAEMLSYVDAYPHARKMDDGVLRDAYLDYVLRYSKILAIWQDDFAADSHPLIEKVSLVRRVSHKTVAHTTLDSWKLHGQDLTDVTMAVMVLACAIELAVGDAAYDVDLASIESSAFNGISKLLDVEVSTEAHQIKLIRGMLPHWVDTGQEFPVFPQAFLRS